MYLTNYNKLFHTSLPVTVLCLCLFFFFLGGSLPSNRERRSLYEEGWAIINQWPWHSHWHFHTRRSFTWSVRALWGRVAMNYDCYGLLRLKTSRSSTELQETDELKMISFKQLTDKHMNSILQLQELRTMLHTTLQLFSLGMRDSDETNFPPLAVTEEGKGGLCSLMWHEKQTSSSIESDRNFSQQFVSACWSFCLWASLRLWPRS